MINGKASGWEKVTSGVPQGSVLGPTLFIIYINDIDDGITSSLLKFADDTKLLRIVGTQDHCEELQKDLHRMYRTTYQLGGTEVPTATQEKDLGIIVTENLKVSEQCAKVTKTANKVLGIIKWSYEDKSMANLLPLYKARVRPHIEYCVQAWRPYYQKDVDNLEKIQRRATRMMEELRGMEYEERLRQTRRTRADIIEVFKIMKGLEGLNREDFFEMEVDKRTRGHMLKILKRGARLDCRKYSFSQRVVNIWNALPAEAVSCAPLIQHIGGSCISHRLSDPVSLRPAT